uniref:CSON014216 protein n=1 Tax=Culicoides sonorensis TaxID=179676 RepID=A0A336MEC4_CULSO
MSKILNLIVICAIIGCVSAKSIDWETRIVGGNETTIQNHPYQASILAPGYIHVCSGAIYSSRYIITAGHCIYRAIPYEVRVSVGSTAYASGQIYTVDRIIWHASFRPDPLFYDIGLVRTSYNMLFSDTVKPIALNSELFSGPTNATTTGWGSYSSGSGPSMNLRMLNVTTITNEDCRNAHTAGGMGNVIIENVICANTTTSQGMCNGDAGGPMVKDDKLIGLVSWGVPCARGYPDVYVRISSHVDWIIRNAI